MPIYEYRCSECQHEVEALQKLSDPPLLACPACGKEALQKLVSAAGFQLKGSGWYVTDFRGGGGGKKVDKTDKADTTDKPAAEAAKGSETKTESTTKTESAAPAASTTSTSPSGSSES